MFNERLLGLALGTPNELDTDCSLSSLQPSTQGQRPRGEQSLPGNPTRGSDWDVDIQSNWGSGNFTGGGRWNLGAWVQ